MAEGDITKRVKLEMRSCFAIPVAVMDTPDSAARISIAINLSL